MPYLVEEHYLAGIPQTALLGGLPSRGISVHWTAGSPGRAGARGTAQFFVDRADRNASYHELWWWEAATGTFGVLLIVRSTRAAHSMNPTPPPAGPYAPNAEVRRILGDRVGDPNAASYAVSFAGMPADLAAAMRDPRFVAYATRRIRELLVSEDTIRDPRPLFNHGWAQPSTRYDAGEALIPAIYRALYPEAIDEMPDLSRLEPIVNRYVTVRKGATPRRSPAFNPQAYDENAVRDRDGAVVREPSDRQRVALAWVEGTNLTLSDGSVADARTRWVLTGSDSSGGIFYHESDAIAWTPIERVEVVKEVPTGLSEQEVFEAVDATAKAARAVADTYKPV